MITGEREGGGSTRTEKTVALHFPSAWVWGEDLVVAGRANSARYGTMPATVYSHRKRQISSLSYSGWISIGILDMVEETDRRCLMMKAVQQF